jgi:EAL domain-containing protein (putative c-di-GMP-specific phosphodiesterase class I)
MPPGNVVFEVVESDLARDPADTHRIREYLRRNGLGFAVSRAGVGAGADSFEAVCNCGPDYINLDGRLIGDIDQPACAPMIGKLVTMAEKSGARVVAQGVDCFRILENLLLSGVQLMQGRLFGEPSRGIQASR